MDIPCKTSQKEKNKKHLVKFLVYAVLSQFPTCCYSRAFPLPLNWSSSILPFPPFETHFNPLVNTGSSSD